MAFNLKALAATEERVQKRRELVEQVEEGTLSPAQAQEEADRQGLGRLDRVAGKSQFPVAHEPIWSPIMALAWMFWRDYDLVTDFYDPYRSACLSWRIVARTSRVYGRPPPPPQPTRWYLGTRSLASLSDLKIAADRENRAGRANNFPEFAKGKAEFFTALYSGRIAATGIRAATGELERIDSFRWAVLDFVEPGQRLADGGPVDTRNFQFVEKHKPGEIYYSDVQLSRLDIEREWPQTKTSVPVQIVAQTRRGEPASKRGRPAAYNWTAFRAEALRLLDNEGSFDPTVDLTWNQAELENRMRNWCAAQWQREPAESTIRQHVVSAYEKFLEAKKAEN